MFLGTFCLWNPVFFSFHVLAEWARPCSHGEIIVDGPRRLTLTHILVQRLELPLSLTAATAVSDAHAMFPVSVEGNQNHNSPWTIWDQIFLHGVTTHFILRVKENVSPEHLEWTLRPKRIDRIDLTWGNPSQVLKICRFSQVESSAAPQLSAWFQIIRRMALTHAAGSHVGKMRESSCLTNLRVKRVLIFPGGKRCSKPAKTQKWWNARAMLGVGYF
jgi:hypothetical protein